MPYNDVYVHLITKSYYSSISQVTVRYLDEEQNVLIANLKGNNIEKAHDFYMGFTLIF